jgi:Protein of unknown function (DUF1553)/Protein of unknown function (DUF1549)
MIRYYLAIIILIAALYGPGAQSAIVLPFETDKANVEATPIDDLVQAALNKQGITPANLCSDEVFIRRAYLDVIGALPEPWKVREFLKDKRPNKRAKLIDALLKREEFADYWSLRWGDILRVKAEFPINLWPNAVQAYHRWIHDAMQDNMPYDQFVRELLTSSGSNFRVPPVNFYRAIQGHEPSTIARAVALTFMGTRTENWTKKRRADMEVFFSRVGYKPTAEWKEEIVQLDPKPVRTLKTAFPDGDRTRIQSHEDPRVVFTNWLITPENPWFSRNIVNRLWAWLMGRGIIHEPDDIRPDNLASNPQLLAYLEKELVEANYDLRHIYRLILNSRTYQQSSIGQSKHPDSEALFAQYPVRRLDAEILIDAMHQVFGGGENYSSPIPEPFTFIPSNQRTVALADGSITSPFLDMFGRPARDTGFSSERNNHPTDAQSLHLLNSSSIQERIERSWRLNGLIRRAKGNSGEVINGLYITILSRFPTKIERDAAIKYSKTKGLNRKQAIVDLAWALINSKEFLYQH